MTERSTRTRLYAILIATLCVFGIGAAGFALIEKLSPLDALYFLVVTLTTVGYGDIHPVTPAGKMLAIVVIVCGVGAFFEIVAFATNAFFERHALRIREQKRHMVTGLFFSELGNGLLRLMIPLAQDRETLGSHLALNTRWTERDFAETRKILKQQKMNVSVEIKDLPPLRDLLLDKSALLLRLLENPAFLEKDSFSHMLRSVMHLREELLARQDFEAIPDTDLQHLAGDIRRVFQSLTPFWLNYTAYLKKDYPYLFSLAVRINPFNTQASPIIRN